MTKLYNPLNHSVVQAVFTNNTMSEFEAEDFHEALLFAIASEIQRVHFNKYQECWSVRDHDPKIPGIHWRAYSYDDEDPQNSNFKFEDVEFNWYKWPGRGMLMNKDWTEKEWREWFDRCLAKIREFDVKF